MFYSKKKTQESEDKPPSSEQKEYSGLSSLSGPSYRSLPFDAFPGHSEGLTSSLPGPYRSFSGPVTTHHDQYHSLNQEMDRSVGGVDLSMPSLHNTSQSVLNPKSAVEWGVDSEPTSLKGLKDLPPAGMNSTNQVYRPTKTSSLQQNLELVKSTPAASELPSQFEIYSSFWSTSSPAEIWPVMIKTLQSNPKVDYVFQAKRNKIKGTIIQNSYSVQFNVRIFCKPSKESSKWNANAKQLVEIQRRSGDAFEFNAFYKHTLESICKTDRNIFLSEASPVQKQQAPSVMAPMPTKSDVTLDADTRKALYSMAVATQNTEAQRESLRTLASISDTANAASFLTPQDRVDYVKSNSSVEEITLEQVLHCALTSRDHEVRRCASTLLANISKSESAQPVMSSTLIQKMFALLEQEHLDSDISEKPEAKPLPDYMAAETKRQITKAISSLSMIPSSCKIMASQPDYLRLLRQQTEDVDPRLTIYANDAVAQMAPQLGLAR